MAPFLQPGRMMDSDHLELRTFARKHAGTDPDPQRQMIALYYAVRDGWRYDPYRLDLSESGMRASNMLTRDHGYCIEKANLLGACARVLGVPSRLGFANVRNHIGTDKLQELLQTDVLVFHGYVELYLNGRWVKATPAFNRALCERLGVPPLEFDGAHDSVFQQYDAEGKRFMEYLKDHGTFSDWPRELFLAELRKHYGHLFEQDGGGRGSDNEYFEWKGL